MTPWRTWAQNALTLTDRTAKASSAANASRVRRNSVKRGWAARYERSNALSLEKSGGLGNTPWLNANARIGTATTRSKMLSTRRLEATAG